MTAISVKTKSIPADVEKDFGKYLDGMVDMLAREIDAPVATIISALAARYNIDENECRRCMKTVDSQFTANNNVVYFDHLDGKFVKRTNHLAKVIKTMTAIGHALESVEPDADGDMIHSVYEQIEAVFATKAAHNKWREERNAETQS